MEYVPLLGITALLPLILLTIKALREGSLEVRFLVIAYLAGQVLCWVVGLLGCVYLPIDEASGTLNVSPKNSGFFNCPFPPEVGYIGRHPLSSMLLINLVTWGGAIACVLVYPFRSSKQRRHREFEKLPLMSIQYGVWIGGGLFLIFVLLGYLGNAQEARNMVGNALIPGSLLYFLSALGRLQYVFFFFLGASLRQPLGSWQNGVIAMVVMGGIIGLGITQGGREVAVYVAFLFLGGSLYSSLKIKQTVGIVSGMLPILLIFFMAIQTTRGAGFGYMDIPTRIQYLLKSLVPGTDWYAGYRITEKTLTQLKKEKVPETVINKLKPLLVKTNDLTVFYNESQMTQELNQQLEEKNKQFESLIKKYSIQVYRASNKSFRDYVYPLLTRLTEPSGQLVIDRITENQQYIGFQNFERLLSIFLPKFIFGEKLSAVTSHPRRTKEMVAIH